MQTFEQHEPVLTGGRGAAGSSGRSSWRPTRRSAALRPRPRPGRGACRGRGAGRPGSRRSVSLAELPGQVEPEDLAAGHPGAQDPGRLPSRGALRAPGGRTRTTRRLDGTRTWPDAPRQGRGRATRCAKWARRRFSASLQAAMERLPASLREVFQLQAIEGLETDEVCRRLGITPGQLLGEAAPGPQDPVARTRRPSLSRTARAPVAPEVWLPLVSSQSTVHAPLLALSHPCNRLRAADQRSRSTHPVLARGGPPRAHHALSSFPTREPDGKTIH